MIRSFLQKDGKLIADIPIRDYAKEATGKSVLWIDIENFSKDELYALKDIFNLHHLAIEDCLKFVELPKIDDYKDYLFCVFHKIDFDPKKSSFKMEEIDFFLGKNFIITVHMKPSPIIAKQIEKILENGCITGGSPDRLMHSIMDSMIDNYFPLLDHWDEYIIQLEHIISKGSSDSMSEKLLSLKRDFSKLRKSLNPQRDLISKLAKREYPLISEKSTMYFKDIQDHMFRIYSTLENYNDMATMIFDLYISSISLKLNETSNKLNIVMQKLTLVSTIFLPLTFIASLYGMNFKHMPELDWEYSYYIVILFMTIISFWMYMFFRKKHLL